MGFILLKASGQMKNELFTHFAPEIATGNSVLRAGVAAEAVLDVAVQDEILFLRREGFGRSISTAHPG